MKEPYLNKQYLSEIISSSYNTKKKLDHNTGNVNHASVAIFFFFFSNFCLNSLYA